MGLPIRGFPDLGQDRVLELVGRPKVGLRRAVCYLAFTTPPTVEDPVPLHESLP